jgi:DNA-binding helix-hairpin-helix protein with protein kinase domain
MPAALIDDQGQPVALGLEIGRGGEGAVYDLIGRPDLVAKLYLVPPSKDQVKKLLAMSLAKSEKLFKLSAWPAGLVLDRGNAIGFLMPKISGFKPAFELYGPKLRLQNFPKADWRFLIRAAANTARAVSAIHDAGHVIGDINHGNMVVGQDATVRLIDCDSFQVSIGGRTWFCDVGVPTHQPPELQSVSFSGITRTRDHDAFGLAVIIFQLLCMARHPFSGKWLGPGDPPSIEDSIKNFRYAYSLNHAHTRMAPPPGSLPMTALGDPISLLFEQAFSRPCVQKNARPSGIEWSTALIGLEENLRQCSLVSSHYFLKGISTCPWCTIEAQSGAILFPVTFIKSTSSADGFMALWQQVEAVMLPVQKPPLSIPILPRPSIAARKAGRFRKASVVGLATYAASVCFGLPSIQSNPELLVELISPALFVFVLILNFAGKKFFLDFKVYKEKWQILGSRLITPTRRPLPRGRLMRQN